MEKHLFKVVATLLVVLCVAKESHGQLVKSRCNTADKKAGQFIEGYSEAVIALAYTYPGYPIDIEDEFKKTLQYLELVLDSATSEQLTSEDVLEYMELPTNDFADLKRISSIKLAQIEIAKAASDINNVVIFVDGQDSYYELSNYEDEFFQDRVLNGRINLKITNIDGPWIRDYGPVVLTGDEKIRVLDASYKDSRIASEKAKSLNEQYRDLGSQYEVILTIMEVIESGYIKDKPLLDSLNSLVDIYAKKLEYQQKYVEHMEKVRATRNRDDHFPELLANETMDVRKFELKHPQLNMDGGNFLKTPECDCILTYDVIAKNQNDRNRVTQILTDQYMCERVIYLDPLPEAIKHIDMFLIPFGKRQIILPSFNPKEEVLKPFFEDLSPYLKQKAIEAEIAMRRNGKILEENYGYEVEFIPGLYPEISRTGNLYYPTIMNALIQVGEIDDKASLQIIFPFYEGIQEAVQKYSINKIEEMFKSAYRGIVEEISIRQIHSNDVAPLQGAVHCLTLSVPFNATTFSDNWYVNEYNKLQAVVADIENPKIDFKLDGVWVLEEGDTVNSKLFNLDVGDSLKFYTMKSILIEDPISNYKQFRLEAMEKLDRDFFYSLIVPLASNDYSKRLEVFLEFIREDYLSIEDEFENVYYLKRVRESN